MKNEVGGEKERPGQYIDSDSPFCRNCTRDDCPTNGDGCKAWETYFIDNWNKNIRKSIGNHKKQRQFFRYEHPDLVREGIVFRHEQGEPVKNCTPPRWGKVPRGNKGKQKGNAK